MLFGASVFFCFPAAFFVSPPPSCRPFLPLFSCGHTEKKRNRGTKKNWGQQREGRPRNGEKTLSLTPICQKLNDRFLTRIITDGLSERGRNRQQRPNDAISGGAVIGGPGHGHRTGKITLLLLLFAKWEILIRYNKNSSRKHRKKYSSHDNFRP